MKVRWSNSALSDLDRVRSFIEIADRDAAARIVLALASAPDKLLAFPRLGTMVEDYAPREVRKLIVGKYEMRYELFEDQIIIVRLWHGREERN